jgi:ATP-dependent Clp protease ATP-binding subunit ClpA
MSDTDKFNRLTDASTHAIYLAQQEARRARTSVVDTEHLLLGLIQEPHASIADLLDRHGITLECVRAQSARYATLWNLLFSWDRLTLSMAGKQALQHAINLAETIDAKYGFGDAVEPEHLYLGLLAGYPATSNHATDIFRRLGVDPKVLAKAAKKSFIKRKSW